MPRRSCKSAKRSRQVLGARDRNAGEAHDRSAAGETEVVKDVHTRAAEERACALGTRVRIVRKGKGDASKSIGDENELHRIYEQLTEKVETKRIDSAT